MRSPPKLIKRGDLVSEWIVEYLEYLRDLSPECVWICPKTLYLKLTGTFKIYPAKRLKGWQLLNIVKQLDPSLWCHLFRDSLGADIVKKYDGDVVSVYEVQCILDLENTSTAFRYLKRYV